MTGSRSFRNFLSYKGFLSRTGFVLFGIGFFLSIVSFMKGIQILMFIPALVLGLFLYSFYEMRVLKRSLRASLNRERGSYLLHIHASPKTSFFFRLGVKHGGNIRLLQPQDGNGFRFDMGGGEGDEIIVFFKGSFDIFRYIVSAGTIVRDTEKEKNLQLSREDTGNRFIHVRKYEDGDATTRLDSIKSSFFNAPYIKSIEHYSTRNRDDRSGMVQGDLLIRSDIPLISRNDLRRAGMIHWLLIALDSAIIAIQWENILLDAILFSTFGISLLLGIIVPRRLRTGSLKNLLVSLLFFLMFLLTIKNGGDISGPGSVFLTQILMLKKTFPDDKEDGFLYIFLSMFVFVAVSLYSLSLWFILFFLCYLLLAVLLLTTVSGYAVGEKLVSSLGTRQGWKEYSKMIFSCFASMFILFLILPHGENTRESKAPTDMVKQPTVSGYGNEINLKNVGKISVDATKQIVVDGLDRNDALAFEEYYWRGGRFTQYRDGKWIPRAMRVEPSAGGGLVPTKNAKMYHITFYSAGTQRLFFPKNPIFLERSDDAMKGGFGVQADDKAIHLTLTPFYNPISVNAYFRTDPNGNIQEETAEPMDFDISMDRQTQTLFAGFWSGIDKRYTKNPVHLNAYIKSKYGFSYSTSEPAKDMQSFLYGEKRGHCEYFATVLALTLQHYGYKATLVNGYRGGIWNELLGSWVVRGKDSHAWVEVYEEGKGWVILDPTPGAKESFFDFSLSDAKDSILKFYDYMDIMWFRYIANYSGTVQKEIILTLLSLDARYFLFLFLLLAIPVAVKIMLAQLGKRKLSPEERFLIFLRRRSGSDFALAYFAILDPELVSETRKQLFGEHHPDRKALSILTDRWNRLFKRTQSKISGGERGHPTL